MQAVSKNIRKNATVFSERERERERCSRRPSVCRLSSVCL